MYSQEITNDTMENNSFDKVLFPFDENVIELYKKYPKTVLLFKKSGLIFKKTTVMEVEANKLLKSILISTNVKKYENFDLTLKNALFISSITTQLKKQTDTDTRTETDTETESVSDNSLSSQAFSETHLLFDAKNKIKKL